MYFSSRYNSSSGSTGKQSSLDRSRKKVTTPHNENLEFRVGVVLLTIEIEIEIEIGKWFEYHSVVCLV